MNNANIDEICVKSFSQHGEDALVLKIFSGKTNGFFVEVGANDPTALSQTYLLEQQGWRGILVEPQSKCCDRLRALRPRSQIFQVACGAPEECGTAMLQISDDDTVSKLAAHKPEAAPVTRVEKVQVMTLDQVLAKAGNPQLDFISIDVEGFEYNVLRGFNLRQHQPRLLLVEDNLPNRLKVHRHIKQQGYRLVKRTGCNNWYVPHGQPFAYSSAWERLRIFRKMYLGTAFRNLKSWLRPMK